MPNTFTPLLLNPDNPTMLIFKVGENDKEVL